MSIVYIIIGLILLVSGGEFLIRSSIGLSLKINVSKMIIGMTVVSFVTSAPELLVSIQAALDGSPAIAINNVIGSNIANIGLVLGIISLIGPIAIDIEFYRVNWLAMTLFSVAVYYFLSNDNVLSTLEGAILLVSLIIFIVAIIKSRKKNKFPKELEGSLAKVGYTRIFIWLLAGGISLYFGSELLVDGARELAKNIGVSEGVISITVIAIGTSVPELAASVIAAIKGEKAISLGNLVGSNIFNIASVLGITSIIKDIEVTEPQILTRDILWMLGFAIVLLPLALMSPRSQIGKYKGMLLITSYIVFICIAFT